MGGNWPEAIINWDDHHARDEKSWQLLPMFIYYNDILFILKDDFIFTFFWMSPDCVQWNSFCVIKILPNINYILNHVFCSLKDDLSAKIIFQSDINLISLI